MKTSDSLLVLLLAGGLAGWPQPARAQDKDQVTVPKSRLEELERKERELDKLRGDLSKTKDENRQLKKQKEEAVRSSSVEPLKQPVLTHVSPPLASLPQVQPDAVIESMDLANYFHLDAASAEQRFGRRKFLVRGEIVGFEKPIMRRNYRILLQTPDSETRVICDFLPPDEMNAVFTIDHGAQLVGLSGNARTILAKMGQVIQVKGECKGLHGGVVLVNAVAPVPSPTRN